MYAFYYLAIFIKTNYLIWEVSISDWEFFIKIGKNTYFLALGTGPFMGPGYIGRKIPVEEQSYQSLHCLQFHLHLLNALLYGKAILFKF